jgi:hypothetical protein
MHVATFSTTEEVGRELCIAVRKTPIVFTGRKTKMEGEKLTFQKWI